MSTKIGKWGEWIKIYPDQVLVTGIISGIYAINGLLLGSLAFFIICSVLSVGFLYFYNYLYKEQNLSSDHH